MQTWLNSMIKAVRELSHGLGQLEDTYLFLLCKFIFLAERYMYMYVQ